MSFVLFGNDITVYVQHDSIDGAIQILNSEFANVLEWFDPNKLTLNVNKTKMLMLSNKKNLNPKGDVICATLCNTVQHCATLCNAVLHYVMPAL